MRHTSLRYIRMFLIWVIALVALAVAANFYYTRYFQNRGAEKALPALNPETVQSARTIEYSDNRDGKLRFQIQAKQLVETRQGKNFLQGIKAYDLNEDGSVRNEIQSRDAVYDREARAVDFVGDVQLFLGKGVELQTESLHYDLNANTGSTEAPVRFYSESATGSSVGLRYDLDTHLLELSRSVDLAISMQESPGGSEGEAQEFHAVSKRALTYDDLKRIELLEEARLESAAFRLTGDSIVAAVDRDGGGMESLIAFGDARYSSGSPDDSRVISGDRIAFKLDSGGRNPESIFISGSASLDFASASEEKRLTASEIDLHMDGDSKLPLKLDARSGVLLEMFRGGVRQISISGEMFGSVFSTGTQNLRNVEVSRGARIRSEEDAGSGSNEISAGTIRMEFVQKYGQSVMERLRAENAASWTFVSSASGTPGETLSSGKLTASLIEMDYSAENGSLEKVEAGQNVVMEDLPSWGMEKRAATRILADQALFHFRPGENLPSDMSADGNIQIVQRDAEERPSGGLRTWSDHLKAAFAVEDGRIVLSSASQWGNFRYEDAASSARSGRCDYEAARGKISLTDKPEIHFEMGSATGNTVEFDRNGNVLLVRGNVRSVLSGAGKTGFIGDSSGDADSLILSDQMEYSVDSERAVYSGKVSLLSEDQQLEADILEIASGGARVVAGGKVLHRISGNRVSGSGPASGKTASRSAEMPEREGENGPISILSERLEYEKAAGTILYSGGVSLTRGDLLLKSETLEAVLDNDANAIMTATATENVVVYRENWECKGDKARYFTDPERFIVTGSPVELRDPAGVRSFPHRLTYNIADGRIQLERDQN